MISENSLFFFILLSITACCTLFVAYKTRGILLSGKGSDGDKQLFSASQFKSWKWPSDMHKYEKLKNRMRDVGVFGAAFFCRFFPNRSSEYPITLLSNIFNGLSVLFLYLLFTQYFNPKVGFFIAILYLSSFWPYQIVLAGGYQTIAQCFCLISLYCFEMAHSAGMHPAWMWYFFGGVAFGLVQFSSPSGRKFLPVLFCGYLHSQRTLFTPFLFKDLVVGGQFQLYLAAAIGTFILLAAALGLVLFFFFKRWIATVYEQRSFSFLNRMMLNREARSLDYYFAFRKKALFLYAKVCTVAFAVFIYFFSFGFIVRTFSSYLNQFFTLAGIASAILFFMLPNVLENIRGYWLYWTIGGWGNHFLIYKDQFAKQGKSLPRGMRGAGLKWLLLVSNHMIPFHFFLFVSSAVALFFVSFVYHVPSLISAALVFLISISPALYGELTGSPQLARSYFPVFSGLLFFTGYSLSQVLPYFSLGSQSIVWGLLWVVAIASFFWNAFKLFSDVLPARLSATKLQNFLKVLHASHPINLYAYNTTYNDAFLGVFEPEIADKLQIKPIQNLSEVKNGYIIVPPVSSKGFQVESSNEAINVGDFRKDPLLNHLLDTREITNYAIARFKTYASSHYWVHDSEITSYRYLILKDIIEEDRWRGFAWILDASKIQLKGDFI